jgi:hypothetical protein
MFEEDLRAVLAMMRPHRRERLQGWTEYRTGGSHFRATISWDEQFQDGAEKNLTRVPRLVDVLEAIVIGSIRDQDEIGPAEEFDAYRAVVRALYARVNEIAKQYE